MVERLLQQSEDRAIEKAERSLRYRTVDELPTPGQAHPALSHVADTVRQFSSRDCVILPGPPVRTVADDPLFDPMKTSMLRRRRAHQSLYPEYGAYVWDVWEDEMGRGIAGEEARWVDNPEAFLLPPWNPTS